MGWTEVETSGTGRDKIKNKEKSDRYVIKLKIKEQNMRKKCSENKERESTLYIDITFQNNLHDYTSHHSYRGTSHFYCAMQHLSHYKEFGTSPRSSCHSSKWIHLL